MKKSEGREIIIITIALIDTECSWRLALLFPASGGGKRLQLPFPSGSEARVIELQCVRLGCCE